MTRFRVFVVFLAVAVGATGTACHRRSLCNDGGSSFREPDPCDPPYGR